VKYRTDYLIITTFFSFFLNRSANGKNGKDAERLASAEAVQPRLALSVVRQFPTKTIILGNMEMETAEIVASRIRAALQYIEPERLILAPDGGMKYLPLEVAFGKLCVLVEGTRRVRQEV
jgi:5-methyltetrahydropteroyltriglutamate--homocysteine methyltransferase